MKTILAHVPAAPQSHAPAAARLLARAHGSHVVGLYVQPWLDMPAEVIGRGASPAYLAAMRETAEEHRAAAEADFAEGCRRDGVSAEWRLVQGDPSGQLIEQSRYADLLAMDLRPPRTLEGRLSPSLAEATILSAACPLLLVPGPVPASIGRRVVVAWKSSRESARAVHEAVPLMKAADEVTVLTVGPVEDDRVPGADISTYLARHGIKVELRTQSADDDEGRIILAEAKALGADLLVMGAYGRTRLRELVLGGVTRHVLTHATLPVMMVH